MKRELGGPPLGSGCWVLILHLPCEGGNDATVGQDGFGLVGVELLRQGVGLNVPGTVAVGECKTEPLEEKHPSRVAWRGFSLLAERIYSRFL